MDWKNIIQKYLNEDSEVSELESNGTTSLFLKKEGKRVEIKDVWKNVEEYEDGIFQLIKLVNPDLKDKELNYTNCKFLEEGRLVLPNNNSARVHIMLPPSCDYPQVCIARKTQTLTTLEDIMQSKSLNSLMKNFIVACIDCDITIVLSGSSGAGKSLWGDTLIPTIEGMKRIKDITTNDTLFDEKGRKTKVLKKFNPKIEKVYKLIFNKEKEVIAANDHLWKINIWSGNKVDSKVVNTETLYTMFKENKSNILSVSYLSKPVNYNEQNLKINPYDFGRRLFDRNYISDNKFTNLLFLEEDIDNINKIPNLYKVSSKKQRVELIKGIMDSIGSFVSGNNAHCVIKLKKPTNRERLLLDDLYEIISSLSWICKLPKHTSFNNSILEFYPKENVFTIVNKKNILNDNILKYMYSHKTVKQGFILTNITECNNYDKDNFYCLQVNSPQKLFICSNHFIPTHNTTFLEAMTKYWKDDLRIGVVEDSPELRLLQPNVTYYHSSVWRPGTNKNDVANLQWCVQQVNRARLDKLIIGETRGVEFLDFLIGANSGLEGSLTTLHANTPQLALQKMSQFTLQAIPQPVRVANKSISTTIDVIIQLTKKNGKYRVTDICEVSEILGSDASATIATSPIFIWKESEDVWEKKFISDKLRRKFEEKNYNIQTFEKLNN